MVDQTATFTLQGEDATKEAIDSATKNVQAFIKQLEKSLKLTESQAEALRELSKMQNKDYASVLKNIEANTKAHADNMRLRSVLTKAGMQDAKEQKGALASVTENILGMAAGYASVTAAIEGARRSFVAFADAETKMIRLSNATGMTAQHAQDTIGKMRELGQVTSTSADESYAAMTKLREGLNISNDQAMKMLPRVQVVAKAMDVSAGSTAKMLTDYMRNMKVPLDQYGAALEIIAGGAKEANIDMQDLLSNGSELIETAKSLGYTGLDGMAKMQAMLGTSAQLMGDTSKGARTMMNLMQLMKSESFGEMLGIPGQKWREDIDAAPDAIAFAVKAFKANTNQKDVLAKMDNKTALLLAKYAEEDDGRMKKKIDRYKEIAKGQEAVAAGSAVIASSAEGMNQTMLALKGLSVEFGTLLNTLGVPDVIRKFNHELRGLGETVKWVDQLIQAVQGKAKFPSLIGPHGLHMPSLKDVVVGTYRGASGADAAEEDAAKLKDALNNGKPSEVPVTKFMSGYGGEAGDKAFDESGFSGGEERDVWKDIKERGRTRGANIEDRREFDPTMQPKGLGENFRDAIIKKAIPGSKIASIIKADAQPGGDQHAVRSRLRGMLGIEDPHEAAPWQRSGQPMMFAGQGAQTALTGLVGQGAAKYDDQKYGSSTDAKYLTAAYQPGGGGGMGGSYSGGNAPFSAEPAGPSGLPGVGTSYGGQTQVPRAGGSPASPGDIPAGGGSVDDAIRGSAKTAGMSEAEWKAIASIESSLNPNSNADKSTQYKGLYQMGNAAWAEHGQGGNRFDPAQNAAAAARLSAANAAIFRKAKGRDPTAGETYLMHQQGAGFFTKGTMTNIGGNLPPSLKGRDPSTISHDEFEKGWTDEVNRRAARYAKQGGTPPAEKSPDVEEQGGNRSGVTLPPGTVPGGGAAPGAKEKWEQQGSMMMEGKEYKYGSGGGGKGATPAGSYNINIDDRMGIPGAGGKGQLGPVGQSIGSIATVGGLNGQINRGRAGIQIHKAMTQRLDKLYTAGCFGIDPKQWPAYREHLLDMARRNPGGLRLDVGEDGRAQVVVRGTPLPMPGEPMQAARSPTNIVSGEQNIGKRDTSVFSTGAAPLPAGGAAAPPPGGTTPPPPSNADFSAEAARIAGQKEGGAKPSEVPASVTRDQQVAVNLKVNDNDVQFARTSMKRQADKEVREARWNSYSDIGCA